MFNFLLCVLTLDELLSLTLALFEYPINRRLAMDEMVLLRVCRLKRRVGEMVVFAKERRVGAAGKRLKTVEFLDVKE